MTAQDKLAAIIAEHALYADEERDVCKCGWEPDCEQIDFSADAVIPAHEQVAMQHAAHVAEVFAAANGLAVVELPELKRGSFGDWRWGADFTGDDRRVEDQFDSYGHVALDDDGRIEVDVDAEGDLFPDEAERVDAAVLAAVRATSGTDQHAPCCSDCNGTGASGDPQTNGRCWSCRGTGHSHEPEVSE